MFFAYRKRFLTKKMKNFKLNKNNLNVWMNLTKKERYDLSKNDSYLYNIQRKNLLDEIRKEYKFVVKEDEKRLK